MLTPSFNLSQNDNFLLLKIRAPYTKISETEVFFEGTDFRFYSKPYFLRLNLPGLVVENGSESVTYDVEDGSFFIQIPKASPGEHFEGLDLQTKLLAPKGRVHIGGPLIQVLGTENQCPEKVTSDEEDEEFDWEIYQNQYTEPDSNEPFLANFKYGFASQKTDIKQLSRIQEEMPDLLDVRIQCQNTAMQRTKERFETEAQDFSEEHYLADLYENREISGPFHFTPYWIELMQLKEDNPTLTLEELVVFSEEEKAKMRNLPNKEYLLDKSAKKEVLLSLVDILLAYAYDVRTTEGEDTVESAWTICKLSSTLSWLETFPSLESVVVAFVRRSLCYPLYRHFLLALTAVSDTVRILSLGPRFVLKCLLKIHSLFNESEPRYILNDLYITDYCVWIQSVKCNVLLNLSEALQKISVSKSFVDLDLSELETAAEEVMEESNPDVISAQLCELDIGSGSNLTDSSSSDSSDQECQHDPESSESDSSDDDDSSSSLDSDDYSSSENDDSSSDDDDEDSDLNEGSAENCLLLGNIHTIEKIR